MKFLKTISFFTLFFTVLLFSCKDKCDDTLCLNGASCDDGTCICPTGYSGTNCETKVDGFNCVSGNCTYTANGAQYPTLGACQAACPPVTPNGFNCVSGNCTQANGPGQYSSLSACQSVCGVNTQMYNCLSGNCIAVSGAGQYSSLTACQNACNVQTSTLKFKNNTFTEMSITINNTTKLVSPNSTASFTGTPNTSASGSAQTSSNTTSGAQVGLLMTWNLNNNFPSSGSVTTDLNVSSEYFYLRIKNNGTQALSPIYVNYGLTSQTVANVSIPNNGVTYSIGYFKAWSNTNVRGYRGTAYTYWDQGTHFSLPFTNNQSVTVTNTFLDSGALDVN